MRFLQSTHPIENSLKQIAQQNYLLIILTFIFSGFILLYPVLAQEVKGNQSLHQISISQTAPDQLLTNKKQAKQSVLKSKISLKEIEKQASLPLKNKFNNQQATDNNLKYRLTNILSGTPMEKMIEPISEQDKIIAAFLVGIALKESQLGKHSPKLHGRDCYNYWGYRGKGTQSGTGGYTCFNNPEEAVSTISKRLKTLVFRQHRTTPTKMLIWKCGNSCAKHSPISVAKWVTDVSIYFNQLNN